MNKRYVLMLVAAAALSAQDQPDYRNAALAAMVDPSGRPSPCESRRAHEVEFPFSFAELLRIGRQLLEGIRNTPGSAAATTFHTRPRPAFAILCPTPGASPRGFRRDAATRLAEPQRGRT